MNPIVLAICFPRDAGGSQQPPGRLSGGAISLLRGSGRRIRPALPQTLGGTQCRLCSFPDSGEGLLLGVQPEFVVAVRSTCSGQ